MILDHNVPWCPPRLYWCPWLFWSWPRTLLPGHTRANLCIVPSWTRWRAGGRKHSVHLYEAQPSFYAATEKIYSLVFLFPSPLSSFHLPSPLPLSPLLFPSPLSSIFSSHLPAVCSGAPDCTALNRYPCSEVPNTCGRCFSRHLGVEGFSNESCFGMSLYNQTRAPSSINQSSFSLSQIESAQTPFRNIDFSERGRSGHKTECCMFRSTPD